MFRRLLITVTAAVALSSTAGLLAQGQANDTIQFIVSALDKSGTPVKDLKPEEVLFSDKGGKGTVVKMEPFALPTKVTIAIDNGNQSADAIPHYRVGLKGFVEAFPEDVEMSRSEERR